MTDAGPKFSQQLTLHLNGGSKFSRLDYRVYADGRETNIVRNKTTDGAPRYLITNDIFLCGEDSFDNLRARGVGLHDWLLAHLDAPESEGRS